jgi:predicted DNA binding protein
MPPNEFRNGKFSVTFLGTPKEVRRFVQMANKTGARYRVVTVEDAKPLKSPMAILTEKQRRVLITAHAMGYYDIPKKTSITQLAKILRVARSTLDVELRRAERRLLVYSLGRA